MNFTNVLGLPEPLVRAVCNDPYSKGQSDFSVTELITPPRIVALKKIHANELSEDASDRLWSLIGQIGHLILERAATKDLKEYRLYAARCGKLISGQMDLWKRKSIIDYKLTSVWTSKNGVKSEWEQQINSLALLCRENGIEVQKAEIVAIYRDWSVGEARRNKDYPQHQVQVWPVKLWSPQDQEDFVCGRILLHVAAQTNLPECSPTERWAKPEKWAVMRKGRERAVRVLDSRARAITLEKDTPGGYIEHRPAVNTRCEDYCAVAQFCTFFQQLKTQQQND
jgi:hypothetical protein